MRKLNLGAGHDEAEGYIRADIAGQPDILCDARALPFRDGAFDEIKCHHVLEHIPRQDLIGVMNECHRILRTDGIFDIEVPLFPSDDAMADPTHVSFFVARTFDYFDPERTLHSELYGILPWKLLRRERLGYNSVLGVTMSRRDPTQEYALKETHIPVMQLSTETIEARRRNLMEVSCES